MEKVEKHNNAERDVELKSCQQMPVSIIMIVKAAVNC